ncbi:MAG: HAMP domain-containing histidine kinase [Defluviitaleaceae bacterium]|nr:HAMP domain-containing histidine kinase [Defluviitaleaceae bacterium]
MRIFWKQLFLHLGILVVSLSFLGLVLVQGIRGHLTDRRIAELTTLAQRIAYSVENIAEYGIFNLQPLGIEIMNLYHYLDATVILLSTDFTVLLAHGLPEGVTADIPLPELVPVMEGEIVIVYGSANHPALEPLLVVGYPYRFNNQVAGAALVGVSMEELESTIDEMYRLTIMSLVIVGFIASIFIYLSSRAISKPLRKINAAAAVIAGGNFEERIPVRHTSNEIDQLAESFNSMAESLQEQEKIRRVFIANISHDIRSPLTSMRGFLTAMQDGTITPSQQPRYLEIVLDESERLIKLSNNIMDINLVQDAEIKLQKTNFDINQLIRNTILGFEARATQKRLMINSHFTHPTDTVNADEDKIRRCLYNLIDNAVKFTQEGGEITIETSITGSSDKVIISVSDNGPGISQEEQKRIFDRFYKGDPSRGEDKMGSGLGLSIVKSFIRAHGENIKLESSPGGGCHFSFALPLVDNLFISS